MSPADAGTDLAVEKRATVVTMVARDLKKDGSGLRLLDAVLNDTTSLEELADLARTCDLEEEEWCCHSRALHAAAAWRGAGEIRVLLDAGATVDPLDEFRFTPLMYAAAMGNVAALHALVEAGADLMAECESHRTALAIAVLEQQLPAATALLEATAARRGAAAVAEALMHFDWVEGCHIVTLAIRRRRMDIARLLIEAYPASTDGRRGFLEEALYEAEELESAEGVELLRAHGAVHADADEPLSVARENQLLASFRAPLASLAALQSFILLTSELPPEAREMVWMAMVPPPAWTGDWGTEDG